MPLKGRCMCGAVRFTLVEKPKSAGACHCEMCRHWTGGIYVAVEVPSDGLTLEADDGLRVYTSSPWAERAFCATCGSSLWYRVTADGPYHGRYHLGIGALDDASGIPVTSELYIDEKPNGYSFAQKTHQMTAAEVRALFEGG